MRLAETIYGKRWRRRGGLGEGGQGFVYRVVDLTKEYSEELALKRLKKLDRVERFKREIDILRKHPHENIVPLIDASVDEHGTEEGNFIVMPIAEHGDLTKRVGIYAGQIESTIEVAVQIARALHHIHAATLVHRDVKPGNILFPEAGHHVWVADFGLAFDPDAAWKSPVGEIVGPRWFTAPELEMGDPDDATASADVYSLGRLIFFMLSGGRHLARDNILDPAHDQMFARGERHTNLRLLLRRMVAERSVRIADMQEVINELERLQRWDETAVSLILSKSSLAAIDEQKRRTAEVLAIRAENSAARSREEALIGAIALAVETWLASELSKLADHIAVADTVKAWASKEMPQDRFLVQTATRTTIVGLRGCALGIQMLDDWSELEYKLNIVIGQEQTAAIRTAETLEPERDPLLAAIPVLTQSFPKDLARPHLKGKTQFTAFFLGPPVQFGSGTEKVRGVQPSSMPLSNPPVQLYQTFHMGWMRVLKFRASQWPAAQAELAELIDGTFQQFIGHIRSPYKAFGA